MQRGKNETIYTEINTNESSKCVYDSTISSIIRRGKEINSVLIGKF